MPNICSTCTLALFGLNVGLVVLKPYQCTICAIWYHSSTYISIECYFNISTLCFPGMPSI